MIEAAFVRTNHVGESSKIEKFALLEIKTQESFVHFLELAKYVWNWKIGINTELEKSEKVTAQNFLDSKAQHLIEIIEDSAFAPFLKFSFQSLIDDAENSGKANESNHLQSDATDITEG
jgi:hypothetical protein